MGFFLQGKLARDIITAFQTSETLVPQPLQTLWDEYKAKMAEEGKPVRESRGGGFGGSGFKFDEHEAAYTSEKKKFQKTVFGLQVWFTNSTLVCKLFYYQVSVVKIRKSASKQIFRGPVFLN